MPQQEEKSEEKSATSPSIVVEEAGTMHFRSLTGLFGDWLQCHRKDVLDITQWQFAHEVGCSVSTIESYEQNRFQPSKAMAERIAEILQYPDRAQFVVFARQRQERDDRFSSIESSTLFEAVSHQRTVLYEATVELSSYAAGTSAPLHALPTVPLATSEEAEARYWANYGPLLLRVFFGERVALPTTMNGWAILAEVTGEVQRTRETAQARLQLLLDGEKLLHNRSEEIG